MKKTLITLMAAASCAMGDAITIATTDNYATTPNDSFNNNYGLTFQIANALTLGRAETSYTGEIPASVVLDSLEVKFRESASYDYITAFIVDTANSNKILAVSDQVTDANGGEFIKFDFDDVTISKESRYVVYFNTTETGVASSAINTTYTTEMVSSVGYDRYVVCDGEAATSAKAAYWGFRTNEDTAVSGYSLYATQMKLNLIPEPATATLSLLALCGLCARRRRK